VQIAVDITAMNSDGTEAPVLFAIASSITHALRIADGATPAPIGPAVRRRLRAEHGGRARVGQVLVHVAPCC
jgi:hypothetical protein